MLFEKKTIKKKRKSGIGFDVECVLTDKPIDDYNSGGCYLLAQEIISSCIAVMPSEESVLEQFNKKKKDKDGLKIKSVRHAYTDERISINKKLLISNKFKKLVDIYCGCSDHYLPETIYERIEENNNEATRDKVLKINKYIKELNEQL